MNLLIEADTHMYIYTRMGIYTYTSAVVDMASEYLYLLWAHNSMKYFDVYYVKCTLQD